VPPQLSFPSLVENRFFTSEDYSFIAVNKKSTATGIFQLLKRTAKGLGLSIDENQQIGVQPNSYDERLYFYPASCAVAQMMNKYVHLFIRDRTLALLAYRLGEGRTASILECSKNSDGKSVCGNKTCTEKSCSDYIAKIKNSDINYAFLAKYKVLPENISIWMNEILAAHLISLNLKSNGIKIDKNKIGPKEQLLWPPDKRINDSRCRQILKGIE
jgi:hypothetical protein